MDTVRRVIIRDKHPVLEPEIIARPFNRLALTVAVLSLGVQAFALMQVIAGRGKSVAWLDHAGFAVVAILWLIMGALVFLQRRAHRAGQLFLLSSSAGAAFLSLGTLYSSGTLDALLFAGGLLLFPSLLVSFTRAHSQTRPWRHVEGLLYLPAALLVWPGARDLAANRTGVAWKLCLLAVAGYLLLAIIQSLHDLLQSKQSEEAAQSRALLFGLIAGTVPGIAAFIVPLVATGSLAVSTSGLPPIILLFLLAMSYAVLLFELSEADLIVRRGVVYAFLTLIILVVYGVLGALLNASRASVTEIGGGVSFVLVTVLIGAGFTPLNRQGRRFVDWLFYGRRADRWTLLQALSSRLATIMQPEDLGSTLVTEIARALHLRGAFLLRRVNEEEFVLWHSVIREEVGRARAISQSLRLDSDRLATALGEPLAPLLLVHAKPLTLDRRETVPEPYRILDELQAALSIPLVTRSGLEAVLCLQPKRAHDAFRSDDLELLAPIMRQATVALDNALLFARLDEKLEELRGAYLRIAHEQEAERARLARELHDGTAQELAGLITLATVADRQLVGDGPVRTTLDRLKRQAEDAYQGVRRASHALRPPMLDDFGLSPALGHFLEQLRESTGIEVDCVMNDVGSLPRDVELALFRVVQECMENIRKHSGVSRARLSLQRENGHVALAVEDNGRGLTSGESRGIGLAGMRERIEAVGGTVRITGMHGVQVEAVVPIDVLPTVVSRTDAGQTQ